MVINILGRLPRLHLAAIVCIAALVIALIFLPVQDVSATRSPENEQSSISLRLELTPPTPPLAGEAPDSIRQLNSTLGTDAGAGKFPIPLKMIAPQAQSDAEEVDTEETTDDAETATLGSEDELAKEEEALSDAKLQSLFSDEEIATLDTQESDTQAGDTQESGTLTAKDDKAANIASAESANHTSATQQATKDNTTTTLQGDAWLQITVKSGDNLSSVFERAGLTVAQAIEIDNAFKKERPFRRMRPGDVFAFQIDGDSLSKLKYSAGELNTLFIARNNKGYELSEEVIAPEVRPRVIQATVKDSLFNAAKDAGVPYRLVAQMASLFNNDVDFRSDVRKGDTFTIVFEEQFLKGKRIGQGNILAARYTNKGTAYYAIRHENSSGEVSYYDLNGEGKQKAFDRYPIAGARISSHFSLARKHPKLGVTRPHKGTDFVAPYGTPIKATGYGKVIHVGRQGAYGNTVVIAHGNGVSTLYAHMKGFAKGLSLGDKVKRGQVIGYLGNTGLSTGPHLHYEFRKNGAHQNPLKVALPKSDGLDGKEKKRFVAKAQKLQAAMDGKITVVAALK